MHYLGGKARVVGYIIPILQAARRPGQIYVEPFVGALNIFARMAEPRAGSDLRGELIAMWQAVASGWLPPERADDLSRDEYYAAKARKLEGPYETFVSYASSYSGKRWGGHAVRGKQPRLPHYCAGRDSLSKMQPLLGGADTTLRHADYRDIFSTLLSSDARALVYCDPPYRGTTGYEQSFDSDEFWHLALRVAERHDVFVSELNAPAGWVEVWSRARTTALSRSASVGKPYVDKLFTRSRSR